MRRLFHQVAYAVFFNHKSYGFESSASMIRAIVWRFVGIPATGVAVCLLIR